MAASNPPSFSDYQGTLRESLAKKDPSRSKSKKRGSVVLVLEDETKTSHQLTVRVGSEVEVVLGKSELQGLPSAFVFSKLDDWVAFFSARDSTRLHRISFYGDLSLLETLAELCAQKISPLALRCGQGL